MGTIGVLIGFLTLGIVREPKRKVMAEDQLEEHNTPMANDPSEDKDESILKKFSSSLIYLAKNPVARYSTIGTCFRYFGMFVSVYYAPSYFIQKYPMFIKEYGLTDAIICSIGGIISNIGSGILADKMSAKNPRAYAEISKYGSLISIPLFIGSMMTNNFWIA